VGEGLPAGRVTAVRRGAGEIHERLDLAPGELGETLVVTGLPLAELVAGTRLRVGEAVVELVGTEPPVAAGGMGDADEVSTRRAARVVEGGAVRPGAPVTIEAVPVPIEGALDLHPFTPSEVTDVVDEYLARAHAAGLHEVRLIHGRGRGVQREAVRRLLAASPLVDAFRDAPAERGGWGATIARLRQ
jgi:hypothetical protein